jgi:hypothetical protein
MITGLHETIRELSSLNELHGCVELSGERNLVLSEEIHCPANHALIAGARETAINTQDFAYASSVKRFGGMILKNIWLTTMDMSGFRGRYRFIWVISWLIIIP